MVSRIKYRGGNIKKGSALFNMTSAALLLSILLSQLATSNVVYSGRTPLSSLIWIKFDLYLRSSKVSAPYRVSGR
jgi:hypothetical protein